MKLFQLIRKMFSRKKQAASLFSSALAEASIELQKEMALSGDMKAIQADFKLAGC